MGKPSIKTSYKPISKEKARLELLKAGAEEIERLYNLEIKNQIENNEREENERYFNQSSYTADFNYWGRQPYWTIDEGILLILEKEPRKIKWDDIQQFRQISAFVKKFEEIRELARRYVACNQLSNSVIPGVFLAWASRMGFDLPEKLQEVVSALGIQITDWQTLHAQAIELLDQKDQVIKALQIMNEKLQSDYAELEKNPHEMDEESDNYAPELDAANIVYRSIIKNLDENMSIKEQATQLLNERYPTQFSDDAKIRIAMIVNTKKGKHGGRKRGS
jgi:hypothetical protein